MARQFAKQFYRSKEWNEVRQMVLQRDNYLCVKCGKPAEEVHHIVHLSPSNIYDTNVNLNPANLVSLCRECHFKIHRQDKLNGIKQANLKNDCGEEFEFNADGYLVKKEIPPHQ